MEHELLEALEHCHAMGEKLAECVGFLIATMADDCIVDEEGLAGGREAVLSWHIASANFVALMRAAGEELE